MGFPRRFKFYLAFLCCYFIGVWFVIGLLRHDAVHRLVAAFHLCGGDSNGQSGSDQSKISNYGCQYVEKLESQIF